MRFHLEMKLKYLVVTVFTFILVFVLFFTLVYAEKTIAAQLAPSRGQNICRSYFFAKDILVSFDSTELSVFNTAVYLFFTLENKSDTDSLRTKAELQRQLTEFQNTKNYLSEQREGFSKLFKDSVKLHRIAKAHASLQQAQDQTYKKQELIRQSEIEKTQQRKYRILLKYQTDSIDEALISSCSLWKRGIDSGAWGTMNNFDLEVVEEMKFLLNLGANPNYLSKESGLTALHRAVIGNSLGATSLLIEAGAQVDLPSNIGQTALMYASQIIANANLVKLLLQHSVHLYAVDNNGNTAHMYASAGGHLGTLQLLMAADKNLDIQSDIFANALYSALNKNQTPVAKFLIQAGVKLNVLQKDHHLPLTRAVIQDSVEIVQALLKANVDTQLKTPAGQTAMDIAIEEHKHTIRRMLEAHEAKKAAQIPGAAP